MKVKKSEIAQVVAATFPEYKGRLYRVRAAESVTLYDLNISGGTRNQYRACTIEGESLKTADRFNQAAPWDNPAEGLRIDLVPGCVVVEHSLFCGSDRGLTVYVHPSNMPAHLKA